MPLPIAVIVLGAAAAAAYAFANKAAASNAKVVGVAPNAPAGSGALPMGRGLYDRNLPLYLEETVSGMLANETNVQNLVDVASALLPDYPIAAAKLQAKAASLTPVGAVTPPPAVPVPSPPAPPAPVPPAAVAPPPPPTTDPATGVVTLPPITITPTPSTNTIPQWHDGWGIPDVSGVAIPAKYAAQSQESATIQGALNNWAMTVAANTVPYVPLTTDGRYGRMTQAVVACFQFWANQTMGAGLAIDGLAGPETQNYLLDFVPAGGTLATDGGY